MNLQSKKSTWLQNSIRPTTYFEHFLSQFFFKDTKIKKKLNISLKVWT